MSKKVLSGLLAMTLLATATASVSAAEIKFSGDARMQFFSDEDGRVKDNAPGANHDDFIAKSRLRLKATMALDKDLTLTARFKTGDWIIRNDDSTNMTKDTYLDQAYLTYKGSDYTLNIGKHGTTLGMGMIYDGSGDLDAISAQFGKDVVSRVYLGYNKGKDFVGGDIKFKVADNSELVATYLKYESSTSGPMQDVWGIGGKTSLDSYTLEAEYAKNSEDAADRDKAYFVRVYSGPTAEFDKLPGKKVGTDTFVLTYQDFGNLVAFSPLFGDANYKGFAVGYGKAIAKNTALGIEYSQLEAKTGTTKGQDTDVLKAELQFKF